jgi:hypothetical protein
MPEPANNQRKTLKGKATLCRSHLTIPATADTESLQVVAAVDEAWEALAAGHEQAQGLLPVGDNAGMFAQSSP